MIDLSDINIISNCCIGNWVYNNFNYKTHTIFSWGTVKYDHFVDLAINYSNINFSNYTIKYYKELNKNEKLFIDNYCTYDKYDIRKKIMYSIIDNKYIQLFGHYIYDVNYPEKYIDNVDIYYKNIKEYVENAFNRRLIRMNNTHKNIYILNILQNDPIQNNKLLKFILSNKINDRNNSLKIIADETNNKSIRSLLNILKYDNIKYFTHNNLADKNVSKQIYNFIDEYYNS